MIDPWVRAFEARVGPTAQHEGNWTPWRTARATGDVSFELQADPAVEESGTLPSATLADHGWPTHPGEPLLDWLPVLEVLGELDPDEGTEMMANAPDSLFDLLLGLPATRHLIPEGCRAQIAARPGEVVLSFGTDGGCGLEELVGIGLARRGDRVVAVVVMGASPGTACAEILGIDLVDLERREHWCERPW